MVTEFATFNTRLNERMFVLDSPDLYLATRRSINIALLSGIPVDECFTCALEGTLPEDKAHLLKANGIVWDKAITDFTK